MFVEIRRYDDVTAFAELAEPLLHADPVRHTIAVTVLAAQLRPSAPADLVTMLTAHGNGALLGAAMQSRGWSLITSALPPVAVPAVVDLLQGTPQAPPGATGPRENAEAFVAAWCDRTGATARVTMAQRLFALAELCPPRGVPGAPRVAGMDDVALLAKWRHDFAVAAMPAGWPGTEDLEATTARQVAAGSGNLLWEVGGEPVAVALATAPVAGMSRIAGVWTPPEHRGRGFGSAATAAASRWALEAGAEHVVLFTDLANPVTNSIYPKIGYRPLYDAVDLAFDERNVTSR